MVAITMGWAAWCGLAARCSNMNIKNTKQTKRKGDKLDPKVIQMVLGATDGKIAV